MVREKFVAYYEGKAIGRAASLQELMKQRRVSCFLDKKEFIIRHMNEGRAKVVYKGDTGLLQQISNRTSSFTN